MRSDKSICLIYVPKPALSGAESKDEAKSKGGATSTDAQLSPLSS